jgi:DNA-binding FadR family transcriptional regulator
MTPDALRVIEAMAWSERLGSGEVLPLKRIASEALGGNRELAARVLADLDRQGWVHTDTMGWQSGWLTPQGRTAAARLEPPA